MEKTTFSFSVCCLLISLFSISLTAQDLHFTNYTTAPQTLNPAMIGDFQGTFKVGGIYRDQFSNFFSKGFKSQSLFAEANLKTGLKEHHWMSVGLALDNDKSGDLALGSTRISGTVAYHLSLDKKYKNVFSIGAQFSSITRNSDSSLARTEQSLTGMGVDPDIALLDTYDSRQMDFNAGLGFRSRLNKYALFKTGFGIYHFIASENDAANQTQDYFPLRFNAHASLRYDVNKTISLEPRLLLSKAATATDLALQVVSTYWMKDKGIDFGLGYRVGDAMEFIVGYHHKDWIITGAYDMTVSSASTYNQNFGGFEIGAYKIITKHPKPKVEYIQICPRL